MIPVIARKGKKRLRDENEQEWNAAYQKCVNLQETKYGRNLREIETKSNDYLAYMGAPPIPLTEE